MGLTGAWRGHVAEGGRIIAGDCVVVPAICRWHWASQENNSESTFPPISLLRTWRFAFLSLLLSLSSLLPSLFLPRRRNALLQSVFSPSSSLPLFLFFAHNFYFYSLSFSIHFLILSLTFLRRPPLPCTAACRAKWSITRVLPGLHTNWRPFCAVNTTGYTRRIISITTSYMGFIWTHRNTYTHMRTHTCTFKQENSVLMHGCAREQNSYISTQNKESDKQIHAHATKWPHKHVQLLTAHDQHAEKRKDRERTHAHTYIYNNKKTADNLHEI